MAETHTLTIVVIFGVVYLGMILGGLPFVQLDRTGVALLGAIALVAIGALTPEQAALSIHLPTLLLLFSFMVISAQMRLGGFYTWVTLHIARLPIGPGGLLAAVIAVVAALSAVFSNDVVCLAIAPVLADACVRRGLDPVPFLLALACSANIGSAATLIGNPQNMLIGEVLELPFGGYFLEAIGPVLLGLAALWALLAWQSRGRWQAQAPAGTSAAVHAATSADSLAAANVTMSAAMSTETSTNSTNRSTNTSARAATPPPGAAMPPAGSTNDRSASYPEFDRWQTAKGLVVATVLVVLFLFTALPREVVALTGAGLLLMSRKLHSTHMLGLVDWELLILFIGLFVLNHALEHTGVTAQAVQHLAASGFALAEPAPLFAATLVLSNIVSNVPAVMLLLPAATEPFAGPMLALVSTLAGNLLIVGSIANIIVVDAARRRGIAIDWRCHARAGVPVTFVTLLITALWFAARAGGG